MTNSSSNDANINHALNGNLRMYNGITLLHTSKWTKKMPQKDLKSFSHQSVIYLVRKGESHCFTNNA